MGVVVIGIVMIVVTVVSVAIVGALFVWAARKDGEANDAVQAGGVPSRTPFRDALRRPPRPSGRNRRR